MNKCEFTWRTKQVTGGILINSLNGGFCWVPSPTDKGTGTLGYFNRDWEIISCNILNKSNFVEFTENVSMLPFSVSPVTPDDVLKEYAGLTLYEMSLAMVKEIARLRNEKEA
jgi:hypothetical protein